MRPATPSETPCALHGRRLVVVDVEGNGHNPPEIIEIAILTIDGQEDDTPRLQSWMVRPRQPIAPMVTRNVHGIHNADVADSPPWAAVAPEVATLLHDQVLVAHNASVEHRVLSAHLPDWTPTLVLDTLRLAKHVWPGLPSYGLDKLVSHAHLAPADTRDPDSRHHRAAYDTWCAWHLLCRLVTDGALDWDALVDAAALPGFRPGQITEPQEGLW